jgi:hypothetical protein
MATISARPTADHSEKRPPTQSQSGKNGLLPNAETDGTLGFGGQRSEVAGDGGGIAEVGHQPVTRRLRIEHGFLRREGFAGDQEQRRAGVERLQQGRQLSAIEIGDVMHAQRRMRKRAQSVAEHLRPQVRATDADIDDVTDRLAGEPQRLSGTYPVGKSGHPLARGENLGHHVQIRIREGTARSSQGDMQYRTIFAGIDSFTAEHALRPFIKPRLPGQSGQQRQGCRIDPLLRKVVKDSVEA